jgi:hypothetical protein
LWGGGVNGAETLRDDCCSRPAAVEVTAAKSGLASARGDLREAGHACAASGCAAHGALADVGVRLALQIFGQDLADQ